MRKADHARAQARTSSRDLLRRAIALYDNSPLAERLFVRARALLSDLPVLERHAPRAGRIMDLGCGHGLMANLLALGSAGRAVRGVDIAPEKIAAARRTVGTRANIRFDLADATALAADGDEAGSYAAIAVADVFYLIPPDDQRGLIATCHALLRPGGVFLWKSQVRHPRWKYAITWAQEWLMTTLGPTRGHGLYFLDTDESLAALTAAGFTATALPLRSWRPYTDVLFIAYKSET